MTGAVRRVLARLRAGKGTARLTGPDVPAGSVQGLGSIIGVRRRGRIWLLASDMDSPAVTLPSGSRAMLVRFPGQTFEGIDPFAAGAVITAADGELFRSDGRVRDVEFLFWADIAELAATPGAAIELWRGEVIGHGQISGEPDHLAYPDSSG